MFLGAMQHSAFMPHGICYLWKPGLVWLHVVSDSVTAIAYYAIPPALILLVVRARREVRDLGAPQPARGLPYEWVYLAFGLFIVACGTTHVLSVWNVWQPSYWVSGSVKAVTALASVATAIALPPLVPKAIALFREARISELQHTQLSQLAAIVSSTDDAIITKDLQGRVLTWNGGAERLYGYRAEEMIGEPLQRLIPAERQGELESILARVAAGESIPNHETSRVRQDGSLVDISLTVSPIRNQSGRVVGASAIGRDITMEKQGRHAELQLAKAEAARAEAERLAQRFAALAAEQTRLYQEAEAISRTRSEFLAVMSHELRTPLNAVIGYADLLDAGVYGDLTHVQREQLGRIRRSGTHLRAVIEQVLVHTRIEAGNATPAWERVRLVDLIREAVHLVEPGARGKNLDLQTDVPEPLEADTDPTYLRQILLNLLSNAVKFTDRGSISVRARSRGDQVVIEVRDTGRGIAPEHLEHVFEPFWQVEQGRTRTAEGTGLGLAVARRLAHVLGGDIAAASHSGTGTVMTLSLPARRPLAAGAADGRGP